MKYKLKTTKDADPVMRLRQVELEQDYWRGRCCVKDEARRNEGGGMEVCRYVA